MMSIPAVSIILAKEKSYAVSMLIFSPAVFIFCRVFVVTFFTSLFTDIEPGFSGFDRIWRKSYGYFFSYRKNLLIRFHSIRLLVFPLGKVYWFSSYPENSN